MASQGTDKTPAEQISRMIDELNDWRGEKIAKLRALVLAADPEISEEWKWGSPTWTRNGLVCSASAFRDHVKLNFHKGASLPDPKGLFNAGLEAKVTRAIDWGQDDPIDEAGVKSLVKAAVALNLSN